MAEHWSPSPHLPAAQPAGGQELGLQARPMGLKVHYSFDRDNQVHCLARWPHILQVPTIALDEKTTIGVADLRTCLQAVSLSSPEILNQQENDYSVYAHDYSELDVPLVGQGLLSWAMNPQSSPHHNQQQLVTGRVTRNVLALLNSGSRDVLEVKLKFTTVPRISQRTEIPTTEHANGIRPASIPAETASEWNSFIQSNPMLGHTCNISAVSSPALAPAQLAQYNNTPSSENRPVEVRSDHYPQQPIRPASIPPANVPPPVTVPPTSRTSSVAPIPPRPQTSADTAPSPAAPPHPTEAAPQTRPSRPASRSRSKQPTGRPRGRPRKRPVETGNTSAVEEATDGDEGPQKKRAKVTKTEYSVIAPFGAAPDSLRVTASTSGSLRNMRPVGAGVEGPAASHLQDVPRAPTPVPDGQLLHHQQMRRAMENARIESAMSMEQSGLGRQPVRNKSQDARSPADSVAQSPDHGYSPEDSTGDLNSSPPVPRTSTYIQSSPPASSPVLPSMPIPPLDSGFMSGGLEDFFDDEDMLQCPRQRQTEDQMLPIACLPMAKPDHRRNSRAQPQQQQPSNFPFHEVNPGPPELLPTTSIFNPAGKAKALNRQSSVALPQPAPKKPSSRSLKRSNTAPNPINPEQELLSRGNSAHQQNGNGEQGGLDQPCPPQEQAGYSNSAVSSAQHTGNGTEYGYTEVSKQEPASKPAMPLPIPERPEPVLSATAHPPSRPASRDQQTPSASARPLPPSQPAPEPLLTLPRAVVSEPPCPPSDPDPPRYSKNLVKKQSIKEKLESAIEKGESPPFCSNCGAIETPTWRKIWTQDHVGIPGFHEFSDKPGCVTMIEVLERDANEQPSKYRMVKKNLGTTDDKKNWTEALLCNPCGIWLGKFKVHRPPDRWDKDAARLNQPRRRREPKGNTRSKKARSKSDAQVNPTSEAYFTTDPIGPPDSDFPMSRIEESGTQSGQQILTIVEDKHLNLRSSPRQSFMGSTHSRGSGTADSPIAVEEDDLGSTRRLLFPSPRREGVPKILGELSLNTTQPTTHGQEAKCAAAGKENSRQPGRQGTPQPNNEHDDLEQELFGTPPRRPSTPPPKGAAGPFKTPTRPTPSHRPITRSISRSIRSIRSIPKSPGQLFTTHQHLLQRTPIKTSRTSSASKRRGNNSSSNNHHLDADFSLEPDEHNQLAMGLGSMPHMHFDSPFTATLHQLLSEANEFIGGGSPSRHGGIGAGGADAELDLSTLSQHLERSTSGGEAGDGGGTDGATGGGSAGVTMDFGSFLGTDLVMSSSPPLLRGRGSRNGGRGNGNGNGGEQQFGGVLQQ
ncbi:hypothetical protein N657DRAFT_564349 [Parathielavia appendiculata]|uniref:Ams2/SPT21 N-terminal domain-containing protein n=1 Tax=Parathielavia appendiculata TaxID=2587402 RepID=A0AAN6Z821_9PEZI|nr:hypothetical protein N657DRAFT_564349 [Parathielavia appendiculata]